MTEQKAPYDVPQVTGSDETAELLATWREKLPPVTTVLAYAEATKLADALIAAIYAFESTPEYSAITGAQ